MCCVVLIMFRTNIPAKVNVIARTWLLRVLNIIILTPKYVKEQERIVYIFEQIADGTILLIIISDMLFPFSLYQIFSLDSLIRVHINHETIIRYRTYIFTCQQWSISVNHDTYPQAYGGMEKTVQLKNAPFIGKLVMWRGRMLGVDSATK